MRDDRSRGDSLKSALPNKGVHQCVHRNPLLEGSGDRMPLHPGVKCSVSRGPQVIVELNRFATQLLKTEPLAPQFLNCEIEPLSRQSGTKEHRKLEMPRSYARGGQDMSAIHYFLICQRSYTYHMCTSNST
jgi:hypothetical protein